MVDNPPSPPSSGLGQAFAASPLRVRSLLRRLPGGGLGGRKRHEEVDESEFEEGRGKSDDDVSSRKLEGVSKNMRSEEGKLDSSSNVE